MISVPPLPPAPFDWSSFGFSCFFLVLGFYLGVIWPKAIQQKIDEGEADESMGHMNWMLRIVGWMMFAYSAGEMAWSVCKHFYK